MNSSHQSDPAAVVAKIRAEALAEQERRRQAAEAKQKQKLQAEHSSIELLKRLANPEKPKRTNAAVPAVPAASGQGPGLKNEKPKPKLEITTPSAPKALVDDPHAAILGRTMAALSQLDFTFTYDLFRHSYVVGDDVLQQRIGNNVEHALLVLRTNIISRFRFDPGPERMKAAVYRLCLSHAFNPVRDYLDRLTWDRKPRLDTWLTTYLGAADGPLNRAIGRKVLIAAVRRARVPGIKFDQIMVWEGPQGSGKSSALKILAGEYFSDAEIIGLRGREVMELCSGVWIFELSELEGLGKRDVAYVKAFASRTHDKARPAYGYVPVERARTCIFIGTTNGSNYLADDTGNRRFWPVATAKINLDALKRDRDQLWAEAATAEATPSGLAGPGETLVIDKTLWREAAAQAEARLPDDPWQDILAGAETMPNASIERIGGEIRITSEYLLEQVLHFPRSQVTVRDSKRVAAVMKRLGWTGPKTFRMGTKTAKGYVKVDK